ncbi:sensor histidine kinase [Haloimpatiens sp. FM7330]|uniref:sensor histidine kinase n=1 Tax=Haloimpatiens sp. FM7330 TaxID=3298610 RepID=UPI0036282088
MKFWKKIYLLSFTLFILIFNCAGIVLIENIHNKMLKIEVDRCLSEHLNIYSSVNLSIPIYDTLKRYSRNIKYDDEILINVINNYYKKNENKNVYMEILDLNNSKIFSNIDFELPENREEINLNKLNQRQYLIRDINNKSYIFISNLMKINNKSYKFTYIRDISDVYKERKTQYLFFLKLDIAASLAFALFMYFVSQYITNPIKKLIGATKRITEGNFSEKVKITSKDEVGILADNFNKMSDVVEQKIKELELNNYEKQRFIDNLTHELKTPLTSIIGYADLLRSTRYDEKIYIEGLDYIYKEGKRLEELSFKLMDLVFIKKEELDMRLGSMKKIIYEVKGLLFPKLKQKNINLILKGEDFQILMERDLMKILIANFVDNAIKASNENSEIYIYINKEKFEVRIKDYGIGISKEHINKIFEPFYMIDKARTRSNNGAGLGLSICKKIIDIHNGKIEVESEVNKGTLIKLIFTASKGGVYINEN